jgi:hypothetical protein
VVTPQFRSLSTPNSILSKAMEMNITPFTKAFSVNCKTQGALALAQNVANNQMLQLAKSAGIAQFRDFGLRPV